MKEKRSSIMWETDRFVVPKNRLQKTVVLRGKADENAVECRNVKRKQFKVMYTRKPCMVSDLNGMSEIKGLVELQNGSKQLRSALLNSRDGTLMINKALRELESKNCKLLKSIRNIENTYLANIKKIHQDKVECLNKLAHYLRDVKQFKVEQKKQNVLILIGVVIENLMTELAPHEEILGNLAFQDDSFKTKVETLDIRKDIMAKRRQSLNRKFGKTLSSSEAIRKRLFHRHFVLRESTHALLNSVAQLHEKEVKTMRIVLDKESKLATVRSRVKLQEASTARFNWLIHWILADVFRLDPHSSILTAAPQVQVEAILEYYQILKSQVNDQKKIQLRVK